ncbi:hypothetical protein JVX91_00520 [Pseudomonas sp. PDNC002]|uniref:hypothetical protein n=1 Tax=Pseudomonas sp. PDNC002 TaxID=2811422 RepID=UPI001962BB47|nr:hypothetical protein [Pseudomonas sp. PDNC002]QRY79631.1 hypothetical protein JVX91_00520 [Pseudomonas sp. PDNC002]
MRFLNNWSTVLTGALAAGGNTLPIAPAAASLLVEDEDYLVTLTNEARTAWEIVKASRTGGTVAIERAQECTTASTWAVGDQAFISVTAGTLQQLVDAAPAPVVIGDDVPTAAPPAAGALFLIGGSTGNSPIWIGVDSQHLEDWVRIAGPARNTVWSIGDVLAPLAIDRMDREVTLVVSPDAVGPLIQAEVQLPDWPVIREDLVIDITLLTGTSRSVQLDIQFPHDVDGFSIDSGAVGATAAYGQDFLRITATESVRITLQDLEYFAENESDPKLVYANIVVSKPPVEEFVPVDPISGG